MKATHIYKKKPVTKMKVEFIISKDDIIIAIERLLESNEIVTKKSIEQQIRSNLVEYGDYSLQVPTIYDDTSNMATERAMELYPDFFTKEDMRVLKLKELGI